MIYCNNAKCIYYVDQICQAKVAYYVDRLCVTFRKRPRDSTRSLMGMPFQSNCHRQGGKYVSNRGEVVK